MSLDICPDCRLSICDSDGSCGCCEQEQRNLWYEWLSAFEFLQRALDWMQRDPVAVECGATEMLRSFLQKQWEQAPKRLVYPKL